MKIESSKVIAAGHSFGGFTAVCAGQSDSRVKALLTIDPWLYLNQKEVVEGTFKLSIPHVTVLSEHFPRLTTFDIFGTISTLFKNSSGAKDAFILKNLYHEQ